MTAPLNLLQRSMLKRQLADPASRMYVIPVFLRLAPGIDPVRFAAAWTRAAASFEIFRARLCEAEGCVWRLTDGEGPVMSVREIADDELEEARDRVGSLDLFSEPPVRAAVYVTPTRGDWASVTFHHLALDGAGFKALNRLVERAYFEPGVRIPTDGAFRRLLESAQEERSLRFARARGYWERTYGDGGWATCPRTDRSEGGASQGELFFDLPIAVNDFWRICRERDMLPGLFVQAVAIRAIAEDVGSPSALTGWVCHGRSRADRHLGLPLVKELVLGADASLPDDRFAQLLRKRQYEALRSSCCPWASLPECPYFDRIADVLYQGDLRSGEGQSARLYVNDPDESDGFNTGSQNILDIEILERDGRLSAYFDYSAARYSPVRMAEFRDIFLACFSEFVA